MSNLPDLEKIYPRENDKSICYLKNIVKSPNIIVGDYTFYHDFEDPLQFQKNVLYQYPCNEDKLIIGKFCSIASGAKFIFNGANHKLSSFSTYPFPVFAEEWDNSMNVTEAWDNKGDIVIGNDVWLGYDCIIMSGVTIGDGAIVGTRSIVTHDIPPYTIAAGIPAKQIRKRFDDEVINLLQTIQWWNWEVEKISEFLPVIQSGDKKKLMELFG